MVSLLEKLADAASAETETLEFCLLCGSDKSRLLFWNFDRLYHLPGKFGTVSCEGCGLIRLTPRPTVHSIGAHYPTDYGAYKTPTDSIKDVKSGDRFGVRDAIRNSVLSGLGYQVGDLAFWQMAFRPLFSRLFTKQATYGLGDLFPRYVANGRALEVGCGNGVFLGYLKHHGWNVQGIDLSPHAERIARDAFGIDVFVGQLEEAPFPQHSFDYVHLSHVVEHFFDPLSSLEKINQLLKPDGVVYIEVPNAEGVGAEISGAYWYGWDAPRHLFMFSPTTIKLLIEKAGFQLLKMKTTLWDSFDWAATYKHEELICSKMGNRPEARKEYKLDVDRQRQEAKRKFSERPETGDFISCWAIKRPE